ncbi:ABC transporter substrate-binding protein [Parachitinimonas caeni]|uniref:ABC transporter substrate-binding protein n=1 Tax=Parachitinimonas caeni TaxID=3031301 RepID=A0ABT7DVJ2_9NEIS|nr:ABC transporter substrate-binding protein [Parachitinimonas caeni]MDK2124085.1 ABC transporter substrate-binding protein [Parachitinimonas caeni]
MLFLLTGLIVSQSAWAEGARQFRIVIAVPRAENTIEAAFRDYLKKRGLQIEYVSIRWSGKAEDSAKLVSDVRAAKPDLVYTWGTPTTLAIAGTYDTDAPQKYIRDIPIVFTTVSDPIGSKLLHSAEKPGRNLTGASHLAPLPVQLKAIATYRKFSRLGFIYNPKEPNAVNVKKELEKEAAKNQFVLLSEPVALGPDGQPDPKVLPDLVRKIAAEKADFLYMGPDTFVSLTNRDVVTATALEVNLPTFSATESAVRTSRALFGLFSAGPNVGRFAAYKAAQILDEGRAIETIPAETLQKFSLLINMPTAKALRVYPPLSLLNVADVVVTPPPPVTPANPQAALPSGGPVTPAAVGAK